MPDPAISTDIRAALDQGDVARALDLAGAAADAHPGEAGLQRLLATAQRAAGQTANAMASIDRAIALDPDDAQAHFDHAGLLLGERQADAAQAALERSIRLDPNLFGAYVLLAQLAIGRGGIDEADRLGRLAARIEPGHPQLLAVQGTVALRRGDAARAQAILAPALEAFPDDTHLAYALGFTYLELGHFAFAEQAFRNVLAQHPDAENLHALIADMLRQQGRPQDALAELAPLLADGQPRPGLRRIAGELELAAGQPGRALPWLREALGSDPQDAATLRALMEVWRRTGDSEQARGTLDAALATSPRIDALWQARLAWEPAGVDSGRSVIERWLVAMPDSVDALEARMALEARLGDAQAAEATAHRIVELEPGRSSAELRLMDDLLARDPTAAVARAQGLLTRASPASLPLLTGWLGLAQDRAGQFADAVTTWRGLQAQLAPRQLPTWTPAPARADWPATAAAVAGAPPVGLLWGPPGSAVEMVASVLASGLPGFRADRFGPAPPQDALQKFATIDALATGALDPAAMMAEWRAGLAGREVVNGEVFEWLLYWDNTLLVALRPYLPGALLLIALRDPRDLLLDWLAFGSTAPPLAMGSPLAAAGWLAGVLEQVATLHEQDLFPHQLLRLDDCLNAPAALVEAVSAAIHTPLPPPAPAAFVATPSSARLPAGRWRDYAGVLDEPFAVLTPVARRLGYS